MPVVHSGKDVELRTGNTSRKFIEVWADVLKTVKVDEITLGVSINGEEERSFHRSFQDLRHHNVKRSGMMSKKDQELTASEVGEYV